MDEEKNRIKDAAAERKRHWVRITRACNNRCLFCLDRENQNGSIFSVDEIVADLNRGLATGAKRVVLSGGDPTVHPKLCEIVSKAKVLGYDHVQIITNGRMLAYPKFAADLKRAGLDEVTLSLHSHIEEDFEEMTGARGSYRQALAGLLNAQQQGFIVSVDIVINGINYKTLRETLLFYIRLGVSEFDLLYPIPFGDAWENRDRLFFDPEKADRYLSDAFSLSKNRDLFIWTNRLPAQYLEGFEDLIQNPVKLHDEVRGMGPELVRLVERGEPMSCKGERCRYCFMSGFCADLDELLAKKELHGRPAPPCLGPASKKPKTAPVFRMDKDFTLEAFTDFHIRHRYFVKSLRCRKCRHADSCMGAWIGDVRKSGFASMKPDAFPVVQELDFYRDRGILIDLLELTVFDGFRSKNVFRAFESDRMMGELKKAAEKENPDIRILASPFRMSFRENGLMFRGGSSGESERFVYISPSYENACRARDIETDMLKKETFDRDRAEKTRELGALLQYPSCCIRSFSDNLGKTTAELNISAAGRTKTFSWLLNNLDKRVGLIHHVPCRYDCAESVSVARKNLDIFSRKFGADAAKRVEEYLRSPFLYFSSGRFIRLEGERIRGGFRYRRIYLSDDWNAQRGKYLRSGEKKAYDLMVSRLQSGVAVTRRESDWVILDGDGNIVGSVGNDDSVVYMPFS